MIEYQPLSALSQCELRWLSWAQHGTELTQLRHTLLGESPLRRDAHEHARRDANGLHLGLFHDDRLVAAVTAHIYAGEPESLAAAGLPARPGLVVHLLDHAIAADGEAAQLLGELLGVMLFSLQTVVRADEVFATVPSSHRRLVELYHALLRPARAPAADESLADPGAPGMLLCVAGPGALRQSWIAARPFCHAASARLQKAIPSLVRHLDGSARQELLGIERIRGENLYIEPLSLADELPRLSAQTRLLISEQRPHLEAVVFPPAPARLLDIGAGPAVYLAALSKMPKLAGYTFTAMDLSPQMVAYGRLNRPQFRWVQASVYDTGEPAASYDVVHVMALFNHLSSSDLALREVSRLLRPGGLLYVFDVDDTNFVGPAPIQRLIDRHADIYGGDRRILGNLPGLASQHALFLEHEFVTSVTNRAAGSDPEYGENRLDLNRATLWGLLALLGQYQEMADVFREAQTHYFRSGCDISLAAKTQVYRKRTDSTRSRI